jgi:hypothetical protein
MAILAVDTLNIKVFHYTKTHRCLGYVLESLPKYTPWGMFLNHYQNISHHSSDNGMGQNHERSMFLKHFQNIYNLSFKIQMKWDKNMKGARSLKSALCRAAPWCMLRESLPK